METYEFGNVMTRRRWNGLTGNVSANGRICSANADSDVNNKQPSMPNRS